MLDGKLVQFGAKCKAIATSDSNDWQQELGKAAMLYLSGDGREYIETLELLYKEGPLEPGHLLGGDYHKRLIDAGLATSVVVKGDDSFYALNNLGAMVWNAYITERGEQSSGLGLSRYVCHKEVDAVEISAISRVVGIGKSGYALALKPVFPCEETPVLVISDAEYQKHQPQVGWWVVVYNSGYRSYSPGPEFVNGYTLKE